VIRSLTLIASAEVEVLDVFALLGSLESMDYRKLGTVRGNPMEGGRVFFNVNTSAFPSMWQLQLKVSSRAPSVVIHELNVQVDQTREGGSSATSAPAPAQAPSSLASSSKAALSDTALFQTSRSSLGASVAPGTLRTTGGRGLGATTTDLVATTDSLSLSRSRGRTSAAAPAKTTGRFGASASVAAKPSTTTTTTTTTALGPLGGARSGAGGGASSSSSSDLTVRGATTSALSTAGPSSAETAAVASVLNAVCEKMVGVVSEKTKVSGLGAVWCFGG
jgi:hypothetical protein